MNKHLQSAFKKRQYMLSQDFEIYYYNDTEINTIEDHQHDYYEFYFFARGLVAFQIGKKRYNLKKGDMLIIPPDIKHEVEITDMSQPYERFVFWISKNYCRHLISQSSDYAYAIELTENTREYLYHFDPVQFNSVQTKLFNLLSEVHTDRFGKESRIPLSINDLILHINRLVYEMSHPYTPEKNQNLYENLVIYIEENLAKDLSLETLANRFYSSKYHIAHVFKEKQGISLHQYIIKQRLSRCIDILNDNEDISNACLQCGFSDYSSFYRAFKKEYGVSPSEYKRTSLPSATGVKGGNITTETL